MPALLCLARIALGGHVMTRCGIVCACLALLSGSAHAESWSSVFAAERDTAVFLATDGTLFRAPFNLETREVLWRRSGNEHVVRFAVSPKRGHIAWIVRGSDDDTTRLWMATSMGIERWLGYRPLVPRNMRQIFAEPDTPTRSDRGARGVRLVQAGMLNLRPPANTLDWASDGKSLLLGRNTGIVSIDPGGRTMSRVDSVLAVKLEVLGPSKTLLVDALTKMTTSAPPDRTTIIRPATPAIAVRPAFKGIGPVH